MAETNANDPAGLLPPPGASTNPSIIKIVNTARMDLNDSFGIVQSYNTDRSRYLVTLISNENTSSPNNQVAISLKPENLQKASFIEKTKIQGKLVYNGVKQQIMDPRVQAELRRHYTTAQSRLGFKPEYLLYGFIVLFFIFVRLFGFSRVIMGTSFTLLVAGVSAPDWYVGRCDFKTTIIKFPGRWRDAIVEASGFQNISTKMALGAFIALTLFTGKVLIFTPSTHRPPPPKHIPISNAATSASSKYETSNTQTNTRTIQLLEEIYKFGFEDATNEKPFGSSLPDNLQALVMDKIPSPPDLDIEYDDLDYNDYPPPPPTSKPKSNMGMGTIMSLFTLFRMLKEMATDPHGQISFPLLVSNIKMADSWKLGIFGLCAYKILSGFLF